MGARFVLEVRLNPDAEDDLLEAYGALRARLEQGVDGLLGHQLCQSADDPLRWIITSEWVDMDASSAWDRSAEHDALVGPLRRCWGEARSTKYAVRDGVSPAP